MAKQRNRRRESRTPRTYPVRLWTKDWQGNGTVTNVSAGGLFATLWPVPEEGNRVMLEVETEAGLFAAAGEVAHVVGPKGDDISGVGMGMHLLDWGTAVGTTRPPEGRWERVDFDPSFGWPWRWW